MSRDDEMIREALKLNISAPDEINRMVLNSVNQKKEVSSFMRIVTTAASLAIMFLGTGVVANAATGGRVVEFLRGIIDNQTYVYENGSDTALESVQKDGEEWEQVEYIQDNVIMSHPISADQTEYSLYLKVIGTDGIDNFISLQTSVMEGQTTEDLYYAIRGDFLHVITNFQNPDEKAQILVGLRAAAENTDTMAIRDALLDLAFDYENNNRIFYFNLPGELWGENGNIVIYEDVSNLPIGNVAIVVNTFDNKENSWIFELQIDGDTLFVEQYSRGEIYSEEYYQELVEKNVPIYDLRLW